MIKIKKRVWKKLVMEYVWRRQKIRKKFEKECKKVDPDIMHSSIKCRNLIYLCIIFMDQYIIFMDQYWHSWINSLYQSCTILVVV